MTSNTVNPLKDALAEVESFCSQEAYDTILSHIENLEEEIEFLNMEIESIDSQPKKRRRRNEEEWD